MSNEKLNELLAARRAKKAAEKPPEPDTSQFEASIPKREDVEGDLSENVKAINNAVDTITIFQIYDRLIGKQRDDVGSKTESIMASCPNPSHPDRKPSAWFGQRDGKWLLFCGKCEEGWDSFKLAGLAYGLDDQVDLWKIKLELAENFRGVRLVEGLVGTEVVTDEPQADITVSESHMSDKTDTPSEPDKSSGTEGDQEPAAVLSIVPDSSEPTPEDEKVAYPTIDWKHVVQEETFLWEYLSECTKDDAPEEYHFWHGLIALGHAVGRRTVLFDRKPVLGNLYVCLLGGTGYGKSRSRSHLHQVLKGALPFRDNGLDTEGVRIQGSVVSGEALVDAFHHLARDPNLPKNTGVLTSINGIVEFDELSLLMNLALRQGNTLKPVSISFFDGEEYTLRAKGTGVTTAYEPYCSMTASTQPRALRSILDRSDAASGFLNRWFFAGGKPKEPEIFALPGTDLDYAPSIDLLKNVKAWSFSAGQGPVMMTRDGRELATDFFRNTILPVRDGDHSDLLKRLDLLFKKLMLLLSINNQEKNITADTVERVTELFDYIITCYGIVDSEIGITPVQDIIQKVSAILDKQKSRFPNGMSVRQISDYTHIRDIELVNKAVRQMLLAGIMTESKSKGPGRPTKKFTLL